MRETHLTAHDDDGARPSDRDGLVRRLQGIHRLVVPHGLDIGPVRLLSVNDKQRRICRGGERFRLAAEGERHLSDQFNPIQLDFWGVT